jgi:hypothetical protein
MIADLKADSERWLAEMNRLPRIDYLASQTRQSRQYYGSTDTATMANLTDSNADSGYTSLYDKSPSYQPGYSDAGYRSDVDPANIASYNTGSVNTPSCNTGSMNVSPYNISSDYQQAGSGAGFPGSSSLGLYANQAVYSGAGYMPPEVGASQGIQNTDISYSPQPQATIDLSRSKELYTKHPVSYGIES